jgi:two-component system, sensor histidine kinase
MNSRPSHREVPSAPDSGDDPYAQQVTALAVDFLYKRLPNIIVGILLIQIAVVVIMWTRINHVILLGWFGAMFLVVVIRFFLIRAYKRRDPPPELATRWAQYFTFTSFMNGLLWGSAVILFFVPDAAALQVMLFTLIIGLATASLIAASYWPMSFYAFSIPALSLCVVRLAMEGSAAYLFLAFLLLLQIVIFVPLARHMHRASLAGIRLRFENLDLVQGLSEQRDAAERANIAKSKFLAAASHDLRQPLHSLTLFTSALNERIKYPEVSKIVGNINASVRSLEQLFNALLDISRLDAGVLQPIVRHFHLQDLHRNLINDFASEAARKGLKLECPSCEFVLLSDPTLLERIIRNFVSNAIRYTKQGEVRISCKPHAGWLRIEVADTGIGIPTDQQRAIFSEFYQLGNPERDRSQGLGLGLAIVDRVAQLLGHPIEVQSKTGQGSCFSVEVPMGDAQQVVADPDLHAEYALNDLVGLRVMVVDDEISVREGMQTLLEQWGCSVTAVGSEEEAVAAVRAAGCAPHTIIVDYRLRDGRTGVQAIDRLNRELASLLPALIITGDTAAERLREAQGSGYQLVHKPVQPAMLRAFLRNLRHQVSSI